MNYRKIYDALITRAKTRNIDGYFEIHHIIPRCMGGSDSDDNLARLSPEEHYLAHQLLVKIYPENKALINAAVMMIPRRPSNKLYGWLRRQLSLAKSIEQTGEGNSQFGTKWITDGKIERKISKSETTLNGWFDSRFTSYKKRLYEEERRQVNKELRDNLRQKKVDELTKLYIIYTEGGFTAVLDTGYNKSQQNLVMQFAKYLPNFVPQNGKKRG